MRENGKTWYRICKMLCEYKKYFPGIICCLLGSSFITFIHPLLIRQITDCGILQKNMKYILLFSVILIIISLTQQELNIIQTKKILYYIFHDISINCKFPCFCLVHDSYINIAIFGRSNNASINEK